MMMLLGTSDDLILSQIAQGSFYREKSYISIGKRLISYTRLTLCQSEICDLQARLRRLTQPVYKS